MNDSNRQITLDYFYVEGKQLTFNLNEVKECETIGRSFWTEDGSRYGKHGIEARILYRDIYHNLFMGLDLVHEMEELGVKMSHSKLEENDANIKR